MSRSAKPGSPSCARRSWNPTCPSWIPTTTSGTGRALDTCSRSCSATRHRATTSAPPSSCSAGPCTAPEGRRSCARVGETEFVTGVAAQSASGQYGRLRACAAHRRHGGPDAGRRGRAGAGGPPPRGGRALARHPQLDGLARLGRGAVEPDQAAAGAADGARLPPRRRAAPRRRALARCLGLPHPARRGDRPRPRLPRDHDRARPLRRTAGRRSLRRQEGGGASGPGARTSAPSPHARTWS